MSNFPTDVSEILKRGFLHNDGYYQICIGNRTYLRAAAATNKDLLP